jgi:hypothetical protein
LHTTARVPSYGGLKDRRTDFTAKKRFKKEIKFMCATLTKIAAVIALIGAVTISAVAVSLTVGTACTLNSQRTVEKLALPSATNGGTLSIFDRDCLDWHPVD